jgi:hypothetical protein
MATPGRFFAEVLGAGRMVAELSPTRIDIVDGAIRA